MALKNLSEDLSALDSPMPFDVCIIGSGPAGTVLGKSLVECGVRTVILESGRGLLSWFLDARLKKLAAYRSSWYSQLPCLLPESHASS